MAFDRSRGTAILFGGLGVGNGARYGDTWEWNGSVWRQLAPAASPPARFGHALATDPWTGTPVPFGGEVAQPLARLSVWASSRWNHWSRSPPTR
jgi:hypothetical protein